MKYVNIGILYVAVFIIANLIFNHIDPWIAIGFLGLVAYGTIWKLTKIFNKEGD